MDTVGYLPPIQEGTATSLAESVTKDVGGTVGAAGTPNASKDTPSMMANTVPLAAEPREVQTTTFTFRLEFICQPYSENGLSILASIFLGSHYCPSKTTKAKKY
jgi:hypothetical protein